jgi:hypothetical protein
MGRETSGSARMRRQATEGSGMMAEMGRMWRNSGVEGSWRENKRSSLPPPVTR